MAAHESLRSLRPPGRALAVVLATALVWSSPATGQERDEAQIERDLEQAEQRSTDVRQGLSLTEDEVTRAREELLMLQEALADARGRLNQAEGQVALAEDGLVAAEHRLEVAQANVKAAERLLLIAQEQLVAAEQRLLGQVAAAYKYGAASRGEWFLRAVRQADDPNDLASNLYKLRSVVEYQDDVVGEVESLRAEREELRQDAADSRALAAQREEEAADTLAVVARLRDEAARIAQEVARDEARQRAVLQRLEADAAAKQRVLADLEQTRRRLEEEREQARARRAAAGDAVCPVVGAKAGRDFTNDWGYPRPGGRSHEGTDIFADRGTPVVAMYHGTVTAMRRADAGLGGLYVSYAVGPGEYWYNAHLDSIPPDLGVGDRVAPGQQIGTVGNSGNARTTPPHLHIGHYFDDGDRAENPYPVLADACRG